MRPLAANPAYHIGIVDDPTASHNVQPFAPHTHTVAPAIHSRALAASASSPTFAAMVSLINEARLKAGKPQMGFLNPFLYANPDAFFDVVKGTNAYVTATESEPRT